MQILRGLGIALAAVPLWVGRRRGLRLERFTSPGRVPRSKTPDLLSRIERTLIDDLQDTRRWLCESRYPVIAEAPPAAAAAAEHANRHRAEFVGHAIEACPSPTPGGRAGHLVSASIAACALWPDSWPGDRLMRDAARASLLAWVL